MPALALIRPLYAPLEGPVSTLYAEVAELERPRQAALLAGGHCVPLRVPAPERMAWHKLYSSTRRLSDTAKAGKDLHQAATLLAVLVERDNLDVVHAAAAAPRAVIAAARQRLPALRGLLAAHPQALDEVERALRKR